jgi:hypothetical protein
VGTGGTAAIVSVALLPVLAWAPAAAAPGPPRTPAVITLAPDCGPPGHRTSIAVDGAHFDPLTAVLVTFDVGTGGRPESFDSTTDAFGRFRVAIEPGLRDAGAHAVRADDFRGREATATFTVPCAPPPTPAPAPVTYSPVLTFDPAVTRPGGVVALTGTGFAAGLPVALDWGGLEAIDLEPPPAPGTPPAAMLADGSGAFTLAGLLVEHHAFPGPYLVVATGTGPASSTPAGASLLVVPGTLQPAGFEARR